MKRLVVAMPAFNEELTIKCVIEAMLLIKKVLLIIIRRVHKSLLPMMRQKVMSYGKVSLDPVKIFIL